MPGGIDYSNAPSYVALVAVKGVAYSGYAALLNRRLSGEHRAIAVGLVRTAIGMTVGGAYFWLGGLVLGEPPSEALGLLVYWATLLPLRVAEWWLLLRIFYPLGGSRQRSILAIAGGIVVSYLADIPATIGWAVTGGIWVC